MDEPRPGRPEAAAIVWTERPTQPTRAPGRLRGSLLALAGGGIGTLLWLFVSKIAGGIVIGTATLLLLVALARPELHARIERGFAALARPIGHVLSWLLLVPLFYGFFLPFGLLLRRGRRDRLHRFVDPEAASYWEPHPARPSAASRFERPY